MAIVKYTGNQRPKVAQEDLDHLKKLRDEDIDLSDIPELTDTFWENAERGKFYRPRKQQITVKIDADVLAWLKADGKGYQTRLNRILRQTMLAQTK